MTYRSMQDLHLCRCFAVHICVSSYDQISKVIKLHIQGHEMYDLRGVLSLAGKGLIVSSRWCYIFNSLDERVI